jgi:hypothetical protein
MILKLNITLYINLLSDFQFIKEISFVIRKVMINELLYIQNINRTVKCIFFVRRSIVFN